MQVLGFFEVLYIVRNEPMIVLRILVILVSVYVSVLVFLSLLATVYPASLRTIHFS